MDLCCPESLSASLTLPRPLGQPACLYFCACRGHESQNTHRDQASLPPRGRSGSEAGGKLPFAKGVDVREARGWRGCWLLAAT